MNTKYKFTEETKVVNGVTFNRIEAVKNFGNVLSGDKGGWIEKESNLDMSGDAWVSGNAQVSGDARVSGNALVYDNALVYGNALVSGNAWVYGDARVSGNAWVSGGARVYGKLKLEAGFFFGVKWSSDTEIKQIEIENGNYLVYKGDAKFGTDEPEIDDATENAIKLLKENGYKIIKN